MRILVERADQLVAVTDIQKKPAVLANVARLNDRVVAMSRQSVAIISLNPHFYNAILELLFPHGLVPQLHVHDVSRVVISRKLGQFLDQLSNNQTVNRFIMNEGEAPCAMIISVALYESLFDRLETIGFTLSDVLMLAAEKQKGTRRQSIALKNVNNQSDKSNIRSEYAPTSSLQQPLRYATSTQGTEAGTGTGGAMR